MPHIVLLGDSIFDNARYVPGGPSVIQHLSRALPPGWNATLLAADGSGVENIDRQLARMPPDATHLVVSAGGNNALDHSALVLNGVARSFAEVLSHMADIQAEFAAAYRTMLQTLLAQDKPLTVCTVYDAIPHLGGAELAALCLFNDIILREAFRARIPVIDLRLICNEPSDFARTSPIEPSVTGGGKIARTIARIITDPDVQTACTRVFT